MWDRRWSLLDTSDMDRWHVELRVFLRREKRRHKQAGGDWYYKFAHLIQDTINDKDGEEKADGPIALGTYDIHASSKLRLLLQQELSRCRSFEDHHRFEQDLREFLMKSRRNVTRITGDPDKLERFCSFCGASEIEGWASGRNEPSESLVQSPECPDGDNIAHHLSIESGPSNPEPKEQRCESNLDAFFRMKMETLSSDNSSSEIDEDDDQETGGMRSSTPVVNPPAAEPSLEQPSTHEKETREEVAKKTNASKKRKSAASSRNTSKRPRSSQSRQSEPSLSKITGYLKKA